LTTATSHPHPTPFLLVRPSDHDVTDVDEDEDDRATKSVPPRPPPMSMTTTENSLPSVIVEQDPTVRAEHVPDDSGHSEEVDGLLESIEAHATARDSRRVQTLHAIERPPAPRSFRAAAIVFVSACALAGGAFVGLHAHHISPRALGAALHLTR